MRQVLTVTLGLLIAQLLAFGAVPAATDLYGLGMAASARHDDTSRRHTDG